MRGVGIQNTFYLFFRDFIYLFLETAEGREKERERNINQLPRSSHQPRTHNPDICPDRE